MAEVIVLHANFGRDGHGQYCKACNYRYGYGSGRELKRRAADHIEAMLTAAGFGPVKAAQAGALRDAADELAQLPYVKPGAPGRAEYEMVLAVRRGMADAWLRARAASIEATQ